MQLTNFKVEQINLILEDKLKRSLARLAGGLMLAKVSIPFYLQKWLIWLVNKTS